MHVALNSWLRGMAAVAVLLLCSGVTAQERLETVGLSVYTETARDIYIGGLRLPVGAVKQNLMLSPPPKAMEYRIATRRISSRGFSGTLLLQGELGSGGRAPENVINVLTDLKNAMQGSLAQGDRFVIYLDEADRTRFILNGTELLRVDDGSVFDFFFSGWVGDGSAASFRDGLLASSVDSTIRDRYEALSPSRSRTAAVAAWPSAAGATAATAGIPAPEPVQVAAAAASVAATTAAASAGGAVAATASAAEKPREVASVVKAPKANPKPNSEPQEPASEQVEVAMVEQKTAVSELDAALAQLDDREYQQQLHDYVSQVMRLVYGKVKYPRRAIKYNWEGRVELLARLDASGELLEVIVDSTSGHTGLDIAAQTAVERAAPFPKLTAVAREELVADEGGSYLMAIPVTFALER